MCLTMSEQISFNILGPMLSIPGDLLFLNVIMILSISFGSTRLQNMICSFGGEQYWIKSLGLTLPNDCTSLSPTVQ